MLVGQLFNTHVEIRVFSNANIATAVADANTNITATEDAAGAGTTVDITTTTIYDGATFHVVVNVKTFSQGSEV